MGIEGLEAKLDELLRLYKIVNRVHVINLLKSELIDNTRLAVYGLSDGIRSTREISREATSNGCPISNVTVSKYWHSWAQVGIVMPADRKGRYKSAFDLIEFGLSQTIDLEELDE